MLLFSALLGLSVAGAVGFVVVYRDVTRDLPDVGQLSRYEPPVVSTIYAADGERIAELYFEKRRVVPLDEIPVVVRQAFLAAEDSAFDEHHGIDVPGIARAFLSNLFAGQVTQGGSTITQQVVKALLLTPHKSYERKLKEIVLALRLERRFTKDHILWLYLNQIYLGDGAYGVAAAADVYFGKTVAALTLAEASLLAGLPQAPTRYSPTRHPDRAKRRQRYVLRRMESAGFITGEEREQEEARPIAIASRRAPRREAPDYVEHVRRQLEKRYGHRSPYQQGLRIFTAVDRGLQLAAEQAVRRGLEDLDRRRGYRGPLGAPSAATGEADLASSEAGRSGVIGEVVTSSDDHALVRVGSKTARLAAAGMRWAGRPSRLRPGERILVRPGEREGEVTLHQEPTVEGSLLAMETATGFVRAMVGGYDFGRSQFNRAIQAARQPGSAFKPLVYAAALDHGYTPASVVNDAPIVLDDASTGLWKPANYDRRFHGATRLRDALAFSRNVVSVRIAVDVGLDSVRAYLPRFGLRRPFPANLSLALGSAETTLLELVRAYGVFATGGRLCEPIFIQKVVDRNGEVLEESRPTCERTLSAETAYLMTSMLEAVIERGTARRARTLERPVAGKTGTTNDLMDAWFVGYTPDLVAGAWVGFDERQSLGTRETGGRAALPVWLEFMEAALKGAPKTPFPSPEGIVVVNIDGKTGLLAADGGDALPESFLRGTEPVQLAQPAPGRLPEDFFRGDF